MTEPAAQPALNQALDRLWKQFLPQIEERVATLESAGQALARAELTDHQREAAHAAAHKLAGVLGTFGLAKGTILARQAELLCSGEADPAAVSQLSDIATQLRVLLAQRQ